MSDVEPKKEDGRFVRLRGLPYSATEEQIKEFLEGITVVEVIFTSTSSGRPSGECYCQLSTAEDVQNALKKDRQNLGNRYIEVFDVGDVEMEQVHRRAQIKNSTSSYGFVRIRGLPYNCKKDDLIDFFKGLIVEEVVLGKEPGVEGRPTGEGFVKFASTDDADRALQLNGQHLGTRYLEIFKTDGSSFEMFKERSRMNIVPLKSINPLASFGYGPELHHGGGRRSYRDTYDSYNDPRFRDEYDSFLDYGRPDYDPYYDSSHTIKARPLRGNNLSGSRYSPYGGPYSHGSQRGSYGGRGSYSNSTPTKVFIRGLPFRVTATQIEDFFSPLICAEIKLGVLSDGRPSGDGIVEFDTPQDAQQALLRDRHTIGNRYVELFLTTKMKIPANTHYEIVGGRGPSMSAADVSPRYEWGSSKATSRTPSSYPPTYYGAGAGHNPNYSWASTY